MLEYKVKEDNGDLVYTILEMIYNILEFEANLHHLYETVILIICRNKVEYKFCFYYTSSSDLRLFSFRFLKCEGVNPVTFLNWFDKC